MTPAPRRFTAAGLALAGGLAALGLAMASAVPASVSMTTRAPAEPEAEVRRWEFVLVVRTSAEIPESIGRAEAAALRAGGAVLEILRSGATPAYSDYRMLVRTRDPDRMASVVREVQHTPGVAWATYVPLPETPTYPGGPSFITSYTAALSPEPTPPRVFVHHDVPPVLDKRDLLEATPVPTGPTQDLAGATGGFTLNVSELFKRLRESAWRRREERMKEAYLPILDPGEPAPASAPSAGP